MAFILLFDLELKLIYQNVFLNTLFLSWHLIFLPCHLVLSYILIISHLVFDNFIFFVSICDNCLKFSLLTAFFPLTSGFKHLKAIIHGNPRFSRVFFHYSLVSLLLTCSSGHRGCSLRQDRWYLHDSLFLFTRNLILTLLLDLTMWQRCLSHDSRPK